MIKSTEPNRAVVNDYDDLGRLVSTKRNNKTTVTNVYNALNQIVKSTNALGYAINYEYDIYGNTTKETFVDHVTVNTYDINLQLIKTVENTDKITVYEYDALGRKLSEGSRTFEYDPYDNVTKATYNKKSIEYTYDKFNNIVSVNDANDNVVEYKWDIYGNRTELKYKDNTVNYTYNQFDKIDKVIKNGNDYATYSYDVRGNTESVVRNGVTTNYSYDELNRRTDYVNKKGDETLSTYKYAYDGENNIISETINGVKNTYTYNESDELKISSKTIDDKVVNTEYKYDIFGNKIESSSDGTAKVYRYNDKNQLTSVKNQEGLTDIYYDKNGNIRDIYYAGGYKEYYSYDEFDQLIKLKSNKDREWNYQYDAEGDRIHEEKIVLNRYSVGYEKDSDEWYDYVQTLPFEEVKQLLAEKDSKETFDALRYQLKYRKQKGLCVSNLAKDADANSEDCTYTDYTLDKTVEDALILSSGDDFNIYGEERIATESEEERLTYIGSLNQSVMQTVKDDLKKENPKQTLSSLEYDDAGNTLDITSGFGYNGEKLDETGNIYLRARYYNPRIGQFVQIDSNRGNQSNIASQQRYTYVLNNQYKYVDKNGNEAITIGIGIIGILIIGIGIITSSAGKQAAENAAGAIGTVVGVGFNALVDTAKGVTTKIGEIASDVGKNLSNTAKGVVKAIESVLPEPCPIPVPRGWNDIPDSVKGMMASIGVLGVFKFMIEGIKWDYKYKNVNGENHHIVPWDSNRPLTLNQSRKELQLAGITPKLDLRNIVHISARLHNRTKNKVYNGYIADKFHSGCSKKWGYITFNLAKLKTIFKLVDNAINIFK